MLMYGFDLDETIYPENEHALGGFRAIAHEASIRSNVGVLQFCDYLEQHFLLEGRRKLIEEFLQHFNLSSVMSLSEAIMVYRNAKVPIFAYRDGLSFLKKCIAAGSKTILITDGNASVQRKKVALLKIEPLFHSIYYTDDYGPEFKKPNKEIFEVALRDNDICPSNFTYIGDNPYRDFEGPNYLGSSTIRIRRGVFANAKVRVELDAKLTVDSFDQITEPKRKE